MKLAVSSACQGLSGCQCHSGQEGTDSQFPGGANVMRKVASREGASAVMKSFTGSRGGFAAACTRSVPLCLGAVLMGRRRGEAGVWQLKSQLSK